MDPKDQLEIDARGLLCPLPVLRLRRALRTLPPGATVALLADDRMAALDVPHFCAAEGHHFLGAEPRAGATCYRVRRGGRGLTG